MTPVGSTENIGRLAAEFLLDRERGGDAALAPAEYATHLMATSLPAKTALYYGALGVLTPIFGPDNATSHAGPRILRGCMFAMAVNCWQNPDRTPTREYRTGLISQHLRGTYRLIYNVLPGTDAYEKLRMELLRTLQPPAIPEEGMGELALAITWIAEMLARQGAEWTVPDITSQLSFEAMMERIRSLASRLERATTSVGRMKHMDSLSLTLYTWLQAAGGARAVAENAADELEKAIRPLAEGI